MCHLSDLLISGGGPMSTLFFLYCTYFELATVNLDLIFRFNLDLIFLYIVPRNIQKKKTENRNEQNKERTSRVKPRSIGLYHLKD